MTRQRSCTLGGPKGSTLYARGSCGQTVNEVSRWHTTSRLARHSSVDVTSPTSLIYVRICGKRSHNYNGYINLQCIMFNL